MRDIIRPHIRYKLGNGKKASAWFDNWDEYCPLMNHLTNRVVTQACLNRQEKVADVVSNGNWSWPVAWYILFPILSYINVPLLNNEHDDKLIWRSNDGVVQEFAITNVWQTIRELLAHEMFLHGSPANRLAQTSVSYM
ncbi:reverse transcriptase zinc-binding domain-containing protein [Artemisia annua]|uniref:Reverse transcriptase zinc-binding domain-containing protein n=1 Tax=Artemisia annua TaxID=35608 RepID=A0A2U1LSC0_ARTAN|nr:reverse transcriptase zinc-binding domain-containing protein [Artemisia annua]